MLPHSHVILLATTLSPYVGTDAAYSGVNVRDLNGTYYLTAGAKLLSFPETLCERIIRGARLHPDRCLAACRSSADEWISISYAQMVERALTISRNLLALGLQQPRPIAILSGNDLEHLQLSLGAMFAGIPVAPLSPAWSLTSPDLNQLRHAMATLNPSLVYAADAVHYAAALAVIKQVDRIIVTCEPATDSIGFAALIDRTDWARGITAPRASSITANTIVKILFTSGSTGMPKAVPTTHRMLCSNQQMLLQTFPALGVEPPVVVDWLPWHHTYGASHNLGVVLYNGGTLYIDAGKPTELDFSTTQRNLREIAPTVHFNVPRGWDMLADAFEQDAELARMFFSRVKTLFFGGAGLSPAIREKLDKMTKRHRGITMPIASGLGMTETSPACFFSLGDSDVPSYIGLPAPGCEAKLVPLADRFELRYRGPHVMRGYLPEEVTTAHPFDDEGYFCSGDTASFVDIARPQLGLQFEGRLGDDFKLSSGTFVKVAALRAIALSIDGLHIDHIVVTGANRDGVGMLVFPKLSECRALVEVSSLLDADDVLTHPGVLTHFAGVLGAINKVATGSATFVGWLALMSEPLSQENGELADKGSVNASAVLKRRGTLIDEIYADPEAISFVITAPEETAKQRLSTKTSGASKET